MPTHEIWLRCDLPTSPEIKKIAKFLPSMTNPHAAALGIYYQALCLASFDGFLPVASVAEMDEMLGMPGSLEALSKARIVATSKDGRFFLVPSKRVKFGAS